MYMRMTCRGANPFGWAARRRGRWKGTEKERERKGGISGMLNIVRGASVISYSRVGGVGSLWNRHGMHSHLLHYVIKLNGPWP